jgi:hypothetical protein
MVALEFVKIYLNDLLCKTQASLDDRIKKQREVLTRLQDVGLKVNAQKSTFCMKETENLGYVFTTDGITPQPKKVKAILALTPPTGVKDLHTTNWSQNLCRFLGIFQYY